MLKSLTILLFLFTLSQSFAQEQISDVKYEYYQEYNPNPQIVFNDSLINGFIYVNYNYYSQNAYSFFKYSTNEITKLDFSNIKDSLSLNHIISISVDSIQCIFFDQKQNRYWVETDLKTGRSRLIKKILYVQNKYISYNFYKNGLAFYDNKAIHLIEKHSETNKLLVDLSKEIIEDSLKYGNLITPYVYFTKSNYAIIFRNKKINIEGINHEIEEKAVSDNSEVLNISFTENKLLLSNSKLIVQFKMNNGKIEEKTIFSGKYITKRSETIFSDNSSSGVTFFEIKNDSINLLENLNAPIAYGSEFNNSILRVKFGYSPFTGGGFYNYNWMVDLRDNSYYDITSLTSFISFNYRLYSIIKDTKKETLIQTISNYSESVYHGFILFKVGTYNIENSAYQNLRKLSATKYLVLNYNKFLGYLDVETLNFEPLINLNVNTETKSSNIPPYETSGILIPLNVGKGSIHLSYLNNPLKFSFNLNENKGTKKINISNNKTYTIENDTIIEQKFDKKYTFSEFRHSSENTYYFVGRNYDTLFFYNSNTKKTEWNLLNTKSNQYSMDINYLAKNEIYIRSGSKLYAKINNEWKKFDLPEIDIYTKNYDPETNSIFYIYPKIDKLYNVLYIENNTLASFSFEPDPTSFISMIPGKILFKRNYFWYVVNLKTKNVIKSTLANNKYQNLIYSNNDIYVYLGSTTYSTSYQVLYFENIKTKRFKELNLGRNDYFKFLFSEKENFYYQITNNGNSKIYKANIKNLSISLLDEKILKWFDDSKFYFQQNDKIYYCSLQNLKFTLDVTNFTNPKEYLPYFVSKNSLSNSYFIFKAKDNIEHQLYEFKNEQFIFNNLKWKVVEQLEYNELYNEDIFNLSLFPNPVINNIINLKISQPVIHIAIYDFKGTELLNKMVPSPTQGDIPYLYNKWNAEKTLSDFISQKTLGTVIIKFTMLDGTVETRKLIVM